MTAPAKDEHHWQLPDGRWAIVNLVGDDMPTILQAIQDGLFGERFKIEEAK